MAALRIAVLASGRGSNLRALLEAPGHGRDYEIVGVFSDRPGCAALQLAAARGIATTAIRPSGFTSREPFDEALFNAIDAVQPDLIVCAGYMRLISAGAVARHQGRMINIHPSLLPRHAGLHTHARVLAAGDAEHGASVHCVIPALDAGAVLSQAVVPVLPGDTPELLQERVLQREHPLLVQTVQAIADGALVLGDAIAWHGAPLGAPLMLDSTNRLGGTR